MSGKILVLDDEEKMVSLLVKSLERSGYEASGFTDSSQAIHQLKAGDFDVLLTDLRMPGLDGLEVLDRVKRIDPGLDVILMTAYASVDTVKEALKRGAVDYLTKPVSAEKDLKPLLANLLTGESKEIASDPPARVRKKTKPPEPLPETVLCQSATMQDLYNKALKVARTDASVLLRGESGTGKEVLADFIQHKSKRATAPFVKINCGALPETLLESELFGHTKGSFTGAIADRDGHFMTANGGTILLDEIGEVSPALQVKLLRVIQQGEVNRVGSSQPLKTDVRIIAATNRDLEQMIDQGSFRQDLYYRLNVVPLVLPPLRERREDLDQLIHHFIGKFTESDEQYTLTERARTALLSYNWPGNIRELENAVEHAIVLSDSGRIEIEHLPPSIQSQKSTGSSSGAPVGEILGEASLEEIEKQCILQALDKTGGNRTRAARLLNVTRRTLGYRLRKYNLEDQVNQKYRPDAGSDNDDS